MAVEMYETFLKIHCCTALVKLQQAPVFSVAAGTFTENEKCRVTRHDTKTDKCT